MAARLGFGAALGLLLAAPAAPAALAAARDPAAPAGYFVDPAQLSGHRPDTLEALDGEFTYSIRRSWDDPHAERLLEIAEATYPPRAAVVETALENGDEIGADSAGIALWWAKGVGPARVPYAITRGALDYYLDHSVRYRNQKFRGSRSKPVFESDFRYGASIAYVAEHSVEDTLLQNAYVARMSLRWEYDDGTFHVLIRAYRTVVLTPEGGVRYVSGDGKAYEEVSMSTHRGVGREEHRPR